MFELRIDLDRQNLDRQRSQEQINGQTAIRSFHSISSSNMNKTVSNRASLCVCTHRSMPDVTSASKRRRIERFDCSSQTMHSSGFPSMPAPTLSTKLVGT